MGCVMSIGSMDELRFLRRGFHKFIHTLQLLSLTFASASRPMHAFLFHKASDFRKPCLKSGRNGMSKTAYTVVSCNAEFTISFCTLISEYLYEIEGPHFLLTRAQ